MKKLYYFPLFFFFIFSFFLAPSVLAGNQCSDIYGVCLCGSNDSSTYVPYCLETEADCIKKCGKDILFEFLSPALSYGTTPEKQSAAAKMIEAGGLFLKSQYDEKKAYEAQQVRSYDIGSTQDAISKYETELVAAEALLKQKQADKKALAATADTSAIDKEIASAEANVALVKKTVEKYNANLLLEQAAFESAKDARYKAKAVKEAAQKLLTQSKVLSQEPTNPNRLAAYDTAKAAYDTATAAYATSDKASKEATAALGPSPASPSSDPALPAYKYACVVNDTKDGGIFWDDLEDCRQCGDCDLNDFIKFGVNISNFILGIAGSLAFLMFIVGGVLMLASAGNKTMVDKGTNTLKNAVIGLLIVLFAYAIIQFTFKIFSLDWKGDTTVPAPLTSSASPSPLAIAPAPNTTPAALTGGNEPYYL